MQVFICSSKTKITLSKSSSFAQQHPITDTNLNKHCWYPETGTASCLRRPSTLESDDASKSRLGWDFCRPRPRLNHQPPQVRVMRMVGANTLVVTNAVGSINPTYQVLQSMSLSRDLHKCWFQVGDIMLVCDHINMFGLAGNSPLRWRHDSFTDDYLQLFSRRGPNDESFGPRFFALNGLYDNRLRELARSAAKQVVLHSVKCLMVVPHETFQSFLSL